MKTKKLLVAVLIVATVVCLLSFALKAGAAEAVSYMDKDGTVKSATSYSLVTEETTTLTAGWWVVKGEVRITSRITIQGDVKLILADGCSLWADRGIQLTQGNALTVYASDKDYAEGQGEIIARIQGDDSGMGAYFVIGSNSTMGTLTVNGGYVYAANNQRFGVGGIGGVKSAGTIEINGGWVYTFYPQGDEDSTVIGTQSDTDTGSLTVNGGYLFASAGKKGRAIGGNALKFTINGGTVHAGAATDDTVPVGCNVEINGGLFFPLNDGGDPVWGTVKDKKGTAYSFLRIDLPYGQSFSIDNTPVLSVTGTGLGSLPLNGGVTVFAAETGKNTIGLWYPSTESPKVTEVRLGNGDVFEADLTPTSGGVSGVFTLSYVLPKDSFGNPVYGGMSDGVTTVGRIVLPEPPTVPDHHTFSGWKINGTTYKAGTEITLTADATATAVWKLDQHTLTFKFVNAVTGEKVADDRTYTYNYGESYSLNVPVLTGYDTFGTQKGTVEKDLTITLRYRPRVALELDGGALPTGESKNRYVDAQAGFFASIPTPAKEGYLFSHWELSDGNRADEDTDFSQPMSLTAKYVAAHFAVTTDVEDGYTYTTDGVLTIQKMMKTSLAIRL